MTFSHTEREGPSNAPTLFLHSRDMPTADHKGSQTQSSYTVGTCPLQVTRAVRLTLILSQPFFNLFFLISSLLLRMMSLGRGDACYVPML